MDLLSYALSKKGGSNGKDGVSPTISVSDIDGGHRITIVDVNGTKTIDVLDGEKGAKGNTGSAGKDGTSVTHSWNGTVLSVTSASGTTSADLKGETGAAGANGKNGADGKTPVKGTDYFTDAEVLSIVEQAATKVKEDGVIIQSSTEGSTKQFRLTVDDSGEVTATPLE